MRCFTEIEGVKVENKIFTAKFICDYEVCKGYCCNGAVSDVELNGGFLSDYEAAEIQYKRKEIMQFCDKSDRGIIEDSPVQKYGNEFFTSLNQDRCVFSCTRVGGCALKVTKEKGITDVGIPLSCHLYPLSWEVRDSEDYLILDDVFGDACKCGYEKGKREGVYLIDFLKDAIIRAFGEKFYTELKEVQQDYL